MTTPPTPEVDDAHHADNQRRFMALETMLNTNTSAMEKMAGDMADLKKDTAELVQMWKESGVMMKWARRIGKFILWLGGLSTAVLAIWALFRYGSGGTKQ